MKNKLKKLSAPLILTSLLSIFLTAGCANGPQQMILSPQALIVSSNTFINRSATLKVNDLRTNTHVIAIHQVGEASELISTHDHFDKVIYDVFKASLQKNALNINNNALNQLTLIINTAQIDVQQALLKYKSKSQITLTAQMVVGDKILTKTYNSKENSKGILSADLAVLERDFNQQLSKLFARIVNDQELQQFIK